MTRVNSRAVSRVERLESFSTPSTVVPEHPSIEDAAPSTLRDLTSKWSIPEPEVVQCPTCEEYRKSLGQHFRYCERPPLTDEQKEVAREVPVDDNTASPRIIVASTDAAYLEELSDKLGYLSLGVRIQSTTSECGVESPIFKLYSICHPELEEYL